MSGYSTRRVLMVDDEPNVLAAFRRALGRRYNLVTAESGEAGLRHIAEDGPFPVVVTDMRMPVMNGLEFLEKARKASRDTIYMMLTGNADQDTVIRAINDGRIFRFLTKPCSQDDLEKALAAGFRQHELVTAERVLLRETLTGSIRIVLEALTLSHPALATFADAVRTGTREISAKLGVEHDWRIQLAGSLAMLGFLVQPQSRAEAWKSAEDLETCAESGGRLLRHIPRLEQVAAMVRKQREEAMLPANLNVDEPRAQEVIGAQVLRFVVDLERETSRLGGDRLEALRRLQGAASHYDARLLDAAARWLGVSEEPAEGETTAAPEEAPVEMVKERVELRRLHKGMIVDQDVITTDAKILLTRGRELTLVLIERLKGFAKAKLIPENLNVLTPVKRKSPATPADIDDAPDEITVDRAKATVGAGSTRRRSV